MCCVIGFLFCAESGHEMQSATMQLALNRTSFTVLFTLPDDLIVEEDDNMTVHVISNDPSVDVLTLLSRRVLDDDSKFFHILQ